MKMRSLQNKILKNPQGLPFKAIDAEYTQLRGSIDKLMKNHSDMPLAREFIKLKDALRDDWADAIGEQLGGELKKNYLKSMTKFSGMTKRMKRLGNLLKKEDISREAFVKQVFSKGQDALPRIKNIRKIIQAQDPDLYNRFVGDYFTTLRNKHTVDGVTDWSKAAKEFNGLGDEFKQQLFAGTGIDRKSAEALFRVGNIFSQSDKAFRANVAEDNAFKKLIKNGLLLLQIDRVLPQTSAQAGASMITSLGGKDNALAKYMAAGGLEDAIELLPKAIQPKARNYWAEALSIALGDSEGAARQVLEEGLKGAAKQSVKQAPNMLLRTQPREGVIDLMSPTGVEQ